MKTFIKCIIISLVIMVTTTSFTQKKPVDFNVSIMQYGKDVQIVNNTVTLSPDSFDVVFAFSKPMGILVNASFIDITYNRTLQNYHLDSLPGFIETAMAEGMMNEDRDIMLSYHAPNYWFYDSDNEHRFNLVDKFDNGILCKRSINSLFDVDANKRIDPINYKLPLYLVFISYKYKKNTFTRIETHRELVKINWK